ncbi:hypothetical protein [Nocardiopsis sp. CC223A]|uniref:hypothetical protein n=1 Tax=Nocardiopsis sp. CC223A TaxID=3044051 RepID=UPI00278C2A34|nr:hypothetical protein [Nocardiopsis sp. CC223A]
MAFRRWAARFGARAGFRVETARVIAYYEAPGALAFLDGLRREAHTRRGPGHERTRAADGLHAEVFTAYHGRPPALRRAFSPGRGPGPGRSG